MQQQQKTAEELIELQKATIREHFRLEIEKKWDEIPATFVQGYDPYFDINDDTHMTGIDEIMEFYDGLQEGLPDFIAVITSEIHSVGLMALEATLEGTHEGEFLGIAPTGRRIRFQIGSFIPFDTDKEPGKMIAERVYFDTDNILRQMRGEVDEPTSPMPEPVAGWHSD